MVDLNLYKVEYKAGKYNRQTCIILSRSTDEIDDAINEKYKNEYDVYDIKILNVELLASTNNECVETDGVKELLIEPFLKIEEE